MITGRQNEQRDVQLLALADGESPEIEKVRNFLNYGNLVEAELIINRALSGPLTALEKGEWLLEYSRLFIYQGLFKKSAAEDYQLYSPYGDRPQALINSTKPQSINRRVWLG